MTEWEEERIEKLEEEIEEWEEENKQRVKEGKPPKLTKKKVVRSRAPILLLDEFEKASREDILNLIGKMTDRKLNYTFLDKYFNFNLDISEAIILLTANYLEKVPQFVKDRCKPVNIYSSVNLELIYTFASGTEAAKALGINRTTFLRDSN